jgi:flagellar biosynthetic protein FliR
MRISGAIIFNPLLGRNNVPVILKGALSLIIAFLLTSTLGTLKIQMNGIVQFTVSCLLELGVGLAIGVLISAIFSVVLIAGEVIDLQMGFSMSVFYDPKSGINMPIVGSLFNALLIMVFFAGNAHLSLFSLVADSFKLIPPGTGFPTIKSAQFIILMFKDVFELGLRLAVPILAVELVVQIAMGILMRAVPQINIFTVGIQIQTLAGLIMIHVTIPVIVTLCGRLSDFIIEKSVELVKLMTP